MHKSVLAEIDDTRGEIVAPFFMPSIMDEKDDRSSSSSSGSSRREDEDADDNWRRRCLGPRPTFAEKRPMLTTAFSLANLFSDRDWVSAFFPKQANATAAAAPADDDVVRLDFANDRSNGVSCLDRDEPLCLLNMSLEIRLLIKAKK